MTGLKVFLYCIGLVSVFCFSPALAKKNQTHFASLNQKIIEAGLDWHAGKTSMSDLSPSQLRNFSGLIDYLPNSRLKNDLRLWDSAPGDLPSSWDWRNQQGKNWVSPIRSQLGCGSCTAFGLASTVETQMKISSGRADWNPLLSVEAIFSCNEGQCGVGLHVDRAIQWALDIGIPDEDCAPYQVWKGTALACDQICADHAQRSVKIRSFRKITDGVVDPVAIKTALISGPVWTMMNVYNDFYSYKWGVYKHVEGEMMAGHTITIVGYDDRKKAWILKNSWGTEWGDSGFVMIHYEDTSGLGQSSWQVDL